MKTAEGWYQLAKSWHERLRSISTEELTVLEASILKDLDKHIPDMEEVQKEEVCIVDRNARPLRLVDYEARENVGVQIGSLGKKLWVCIDGTAVLRVKSPQIELEDRRKE